MGTAYTCFQYMLDHLNGVFPDDDGQLEHAIQSLLYRCKCVYSPVHFLAFFCNPFYPELRLNLTLYHGALFFDLNMGNPRLQCCMTLDPMVRRYDDLDGAELLGKFPVFCAHQEAECKEKVAISMYWQGMISSQIRERWPMLTLVLGRVYYEPGSSAGADR
uniref:Uncharacterized protein n=1 Tax=Peronospora matthiolae TaxID=2874970 RepID=A0AAV1VDL6_9STRA